MSIAPPPRAAALNPIGVAGTGPGTASGSRNHLLGLHGMPAPRMRAILARARELSDVALGHERPERGVLAGTTVATLFFEDSTRTKTSFTLAARRGGAEVIDLSSATSSVNKGETLLDTARNVAAMGADAIVVRARQAGVPEILAGSVPSAIINAGDGRHQHPTQGLLDAYALFHARVRRRPDEHRADFDLSGLRVAILGDASNSRVARSAIASLTTLGAEVTVVGPASWCPPSFASLGCRVRHDLDELLPELDAVMVLRIQFERHGEASTREREPAFLREYRSLYAMTVERATRLPPDAVVMHPGPINRGLELDGEVADGPRSIVLEQVSAGVAVRLAVLESAVRA